MLSPAQDLDLVVLEVTFPGGQLCWQSSRLQPALAALPTLTVCRTMTTA
jgi:hypothetical protein